MEAMPCLVPSRTTAPAMLPTPPNRTRSLRRSHTAIATAAPLVPDNARWMSPITDSGVVAVPARSANTRTAAREATAARGPCPEPSATISHVRSPSTSVA
jgi:hypothetical protein